MIARPSGHDSVRRIIRPRKIAAVGWSDSPLGLSTPPITRSLYS
jgi:hypothetical protein